MSRARLLARRAVIGSLGVLLLIQLVPYGRRHTNPPVAAEPKWDSPATRELFFRACKDCHSNETRWPWYSWVAPSSWLVQWDVDQARKQFNISEWNRTDQEGYQASKLVTEDWMPPNKYLIAHAHARLAAAATAALVAGLAATFGTRRPKGPRDLQESIEMP